MECSQREYEDKNYFRNTNTRIGHDNPLAILRNLLLFINTYNVCVVAEIAEHSC